MRAGAAGGGRQRDRPYRGRRGAPSPFAPGVAAVAVIALSRGGADDATATVPPDSVPAAEAIVEGGRSITVSGHGTVQVVADVAETFAGVQGRPRRRPRR